MSVAHINITDSPEGVQIQACFEGEPGSHLKHSDFNPDSPAHQIANLLLTKGAEVIGLVQKGEVEVARVLHGSADKERSESGLILPESCRQPADVLPFPKRSESPDQPNPSA